jgi:hypothetical protein
VSAAIRARLLLALAFAALGCGAALVAPEPVRVVVVRASHAAPTAAVQPAPKPSSNGESLRTDI